MRVQPIHDIATAWTALVERFDQKLTCQHTTNRGASGCPQTACWRIDAHGCEALLVCTDHLTRWERRVEQALRVGQVVVCGFCGLRFATVESAGQVSPL